MGCNFKAVWHSVGSHWSVIDKVNERGHEARCLTTKTSKCCHKDWPAVRLAFRQTPRLPQPRTPMRREGLGEAKEVLKRILAPYGWNLNVSFSYCLFSLSLMQTDFSHPSQALELKEGLTHEPLSGKPDSHMQYFFCQCSPPAAWKSVDCTHTLKHLSTKVWLLGNLLAIFLSVPLSTASKREKLNLRANIS